jgi:hypothetical protein
MSHLKIRLPKPPLDLSHINGLDEIDYVWIEYQPAANGLINPGIQKLAASLMRENRCVDLNVPYCLGYIVDPGRSRVGLVHKKPPKSRVTSLRSLMKASNVTGSPADTPSPTHRLELMQRLTNTFEILHVVE